LVEIEGGPRKVVISEAGDMAYAIGANRIVLEGPAGRIEDEGKTMSVWRKKDGEWEIVAISTSSNKPAS
jgi:ketosteroid isomerase-like protein